MRSYQPTLVGHQGQIKKALKLIEESKKPILYIGGGIQPGHDSRINGGVERQGNSFLSSPVVGGSHRTGATAVESVNRWPDRAVITV